MWLRKRVWLLLAGAVACHRSDHFEVVLTRIGLKQTPLLESIEEAGITQNQLKGDFENVLLKAGFRKAGTTASPIQDKSFTADVSITYVREAVPPLMNARPSGGISAIEVGVELEMESQSGSAALHEAASEEISVENSPEQRGFAMRSVINKAFSSAVRGARLQLEEEKKGDNLLIIDLAAKDIRLRDAAVRVLADRRNRAAVPALIERLSDADSHIVERAIGALSQLGDPRAVEPLIDLTRRRESPFVAQVALAVADIGGRDAEAYLETLAAGYPDSEVRAVAGEALADLRRRLHTP